MKALFKKMVEYDIEKSKKDESRKLLHQLVYSKDADVYEDTNQKLYRHISKQCIQSIFKLTGTNVKKCGLHSSVTIMFIYKHN